MIVSMASAVEIRIALEAVSIADLVVLGEDVDVEADRAGGEDHAGIAPRRIELEQPAKASKASSGCRNSLQAIIAPAGPRLPAIRRRLSVAPSANRAEGAAAWPMNDSVRSTHRRQREAAQAVEDAEHGRP